MMEHLSPLFTTMILMSNVPAWIQYLMHGILIFVMISASAVILTRTGRSPYLGLLWAVAPIVPIVALWVFAFTPWRKKK